MTKKRRLCMERAIPALLILILLFCLITYFIVKSFTYTPQREPSLSTSVTPTETTSEKAALLLDEDIYAVLEKIGGGELLQRPVTADFLKFHNDNTDPEFVKKLQNRLTDNSFYNGMFYELFGSSLIVLSDIYTRSIDSNIISLKNTGKPSVLGFTGDVNLDDNWAMMQFFNTQPNGLSDCISQPLTDRMRAADILLVNNEFSMSDRGSAMAGKQYTFRAKTENVKYLIEMGTDIVSVANNHVFDYGEDAFYDTLETLTNSGIKYVGAGRNIEEAMKPQYYIINGVKIAYVAASRAEKFIMTPEAKTDSPGILRTYDSKLLLETVKNAKANADIVIAYVHWGTEGSYVLEDAQTTLARDLIDAGADIIIGAHPHNLQGIEYYNDKPIVYSLGNFWFNDKSVETVLLEVNVSSPSDILLVFQPCMQTGCRTTLLFDEADRSQVFDLLTEISPGKKIAIDENGLLIKK